MCFSVFTESSRWLLTKGKSTEAWKIIHKMCRWNRRKLPDDVLPFVKVSIISNGILRLCWHKFTVELQENPSHIKSACAKVKLVSCHVRLPHPHLILIIGLHGYMAHCMGGWGLTALKNL